jgi:hypothetical protein
MEKCSHTIDIKKKTILCIKQKHRTEILRIGKEEYK